MDITKNAFTRIRIEKRNYQGKDFVDIRQYYKTDEGEYKPTQKGVTVPPEKLPQMKNYKVSNLNLRLLVYRGVWQKGLSIH